MITTQNYGNQIRMVQLEFLEFFRGRRTQLWVHYSLSGQLLRKGPTCQLLSSQVINANSPIWRKFLYYLTHTFLLSIGFEFLRIPRSTLCKIICVRFCRSSNRIGCFICWGRVHFEKSLVALGFLHLWSCRLVIPGKISMLIKIRQNRTYFNIIFIQIPIEICFYRFHAWNFNMADFIHEFFLSDCRFFRRSYLVCVVVYIMLQRPIVTSLH